MDQFHERRRHGDAFPLSEKAMRDLASDSRVFEPQRAQWIGQALNKLALQRPNLVEDTVLSSGRQPNAVQSFVMQRVVDALVAYGPRPAEVDPESALKDMQAAECSYDGTPNNLASYDPEKLKVLRSRVQPKKITQFLPCEPAKLVDHYESQILHQHIDDDTSFSPYWDPALRFDKQKRLDFILRLHKSGLVKLRRSPRSFIGAFFVKKKTPDQIRLVLDCRGTNRLHRPPPTTRLGSARCYADLDLSEEVPESGWGIEADVNDAFYNFSIPELTHFFAFNHPLDADTWQTLGVEARTVYDPDTRRDVRVAGDELLFPCVEAVPMGWSWALFLCNEAVLNICRRHAPWNEGVFRERKVAPQLWEYRTVLGVYVDNITIMGRQKEDVAERAEWVREAFSAAGVPLTWSQTEPVRKLESVGCVIDFEERQLANKPKRVWKFFCATKALLRRRKLKAKHLQVWTGHFTSLCAMIPCALACLQHVYRFVEADNGKRMEVWSGVRRELKTAAALVWLARRDLGAPICETVEVGDSSTSGYALMTCKPGRARIRAAVQVHEKWRFVPMPDSLRGAAELMDARAFEAKLGEVLGSVEEPVANFSGTVRAAGLSTSYARKVVESLKEGSWLGTSAIRSQIRAKRGQRVDVDVPALVEPLDDFFTERGNFKLLWSRRWRRVEEHINVKECRVAVSALRRMCRVRELMGHRKLTISDNMATVSALSKGRSGAFKMNSLCQAAAALQLGCGVTWTLRHIETKRNVADDPSRNWERPHRGVRVEAPPREHLPECCSGLSREPGQPSKQLTFGDLLWDAVPRARGKAFLELFAGTGRLSAAVQASGCPVLEPVEIANDPAFDLRRRWTQQLVLRWLKSGCIGLVHLGTPCTIWSRARQGVSSSARTRSREAVGIELALFSCEVIQTCFEHGVHWSLEQPRSSRLFKFEPLLRACQMGKHFEVNFDMCSYGEPYRKDTRLLTSLRCLCELERHCNHRRHSVWLKGLVRDKGNGNIGIHTNRSILAGAYPVSFCKEFARLVAAYRVCSCNGEADQRIKDYWSLALRHYQTLKRGKGREGSTTLPSRDSEAKQESLAQLPQSGGLDHHFDFIALGREHRPAWACLKEARRKRQQQSQKPSISRHFETESAREGSKN